MAGSYEQAKVGDPNSAAGPKWVAQFLGMNEKLNSSNQLEATGIADNAKPFRWYTPSIVAGEQATNSSVYTPLLTPDEVPSVVLPTNGLIMVGYLAKWKSTSAGAGRAAIHLGSTQIKNTTIAAFQAAETSGTATQVLSSTSFGLNNAEGEAAFTTTGQVLSPGAANGGATLIFAAAGTYNVRVLYKAESGEVKAKERKLWVATLGV
jgi:hypothetical protein